MRDSSDSVVQTRCKGSMLHPSIIIRQTGGLEWHFTRASFRPCRVFDLAPSDWCIRRALLGRLLCCSPLPGIQEADRC